MCSVSSKNIKHKAFGFTHPGTVREQNEDVIDWWNEPRYDLTFALLADGMGGHAGGAEASRLAADTIRSEISRAIDERCVDIASLKAMMVAAVEKSNNAICKVRQTNPEQEKMGTTIVFAALWNQQLIVLHIGDSRCYVVNAKHSERAPMQLTRDDSVVQAMLDEGLITAEDVPNVPYRNRLTNALGMQEELKYTVSVHTLDANDIVFLCSDGFYQSVEFVSFRSLLKERGCSNDTAEELLNLSLDNSADDNTSLILIGASQGDQQSRMIN